MISKGGAVEDTASTAPTHMVVVGASAGGLQPLTELCATLDGEAARAAVLVVQHLSPSHPTLLPNLLSQHAPLP
ncbi:MAG: chemotaxis protein CheB, partial [Sandaracinaceae bacterium]